MKIKDIYKSQNHCYVSYVMAFFCIVVTVITTSLKESNPDIYTMLTYAYPIKYPWQLLSGVFVHGSPEFEVHQTIGHLGFNLLLVLPFGMMIEKIIGNKKFMIYTFIVWVVNAITFYIIAFIITPEGENYYGAGISGIAFSYGMIGLYILFKLLKKDKKLALKQVSFYLLANIAIVMMVMINPVVAGVPSMIMHLVSVIVGIVYLLIRHKDIDDFLNK